MHNGGILNLASDPERAQGREFHIRSKEQPGKVYDARKLTPSRVELATNKAESNRVRGGGQKQWSCNGRQFLPEGRFMMSILVPTFCASV